MSAGILKRALAVLLLAALSLSATGCANWEEMDDPLGELSELYSQENEQPEPEPLTSFTLPYFAGESLDPITATEKVQIAVGSLLYEKLFPAGGRSSGGSSTGRCGSRCSPRRCQYAARRLFAATGR